MNYLGIDFGTTGLSAVLFNTSSGELYPISWEPLQQLDAAKSSFRLPVVVYSGIVPATPTEPLKAPASAKRGRRKFAVGSLASPLAKTQSGIVLKNFKPYLKICIPYYSSLQNRWEPILQETEQQMFPLYWVLKALQAMLVTLKPGNTSLKVAVEGLTPESLETALDNLSGVVLGCPTDWGDSYRFNLRETVLAAQLVKDSEQIFFIEDAIASVLGCLSADKVKNSQPLSTLRQGNTLVINAGATTTELAVVNLPNNLCDLTHSDFKLETFPYAGDAIDQDIICQLLLKNSTQTDQLSEEIRNLNLALPQAGEPDLKTRDRFQQFLQSSPLGQAFLEASSTAKLILQHQDEYSLDLDNYHWVLRRQDLEMRVVVPFIQRLNQNLNALISHAGLSGQAIEQVICTGGITAWGVMREWLQQKFPNAILIQDTDLGVAAGLASLPLYPQILNRPQQQYSDYFLLLEILRIFPSKPFSVGEMMQLLERRGINTRTCYDRLLAIIEGQIPLGLVPSEVDASWLTPDSQENLVTQAIASTPLFEKVGSALYHPNPQQCDRLRRYLNTILSGSYQKLAEPLVVDLALLTPETPQ